MSTPNEQPGPQDPEGKPRPNPYESPYGQPQKSPYGQEPYSAQPSGAQPSGAQPPYGNQPPSYGQPPYGNQPPSYGQQPYGNPPQYGQPPYGEPAAAQPGSPFQMPADRPRSFQDVMPPGGFSGMFRVEGLPTELKVSYWIWLISGALGVVFGLFGFLAGIALTAAMGGFGAILLVLVLLGIVLAAAQVVLALRMKEGKQWARLALTVLTGVSLLLSLIALGGDGGANFFGFVVAAAATVLMWVPNSQAWFQRVAGRA